MSAGATNAGAPPRDACAIDARHESGVFPKRPLTIVRGEGARVYDDAGAAYLDFGFNYGVGNVGHAHPRVVQAIREQAERILFVPQTYSNDARAAFLEALVEVAPRGMTRAFLANSGAEAIEAAIKFARGTTRRAGLVSTKRAFHGRTMGALSLTWKPEYRDPFQPLLADVSFATFGDEESLKETVTRDTAAVFIEPIQGEGGVQVPPVGYLAAARDIAHDAGALLVLDEIQTGFGRTGSFWGCDADGITPDILCFAKSVAAGIPLGGVLLTEEAARLPPTTHGNTFGGAPLACAAARAVLDVIRDERLVERAAKLGPRLLDGLRDAASDAARDVRGRGLMVALELRGRNAPVLNGLVERGVLALPTGPTTIRYLPPLVVSEDDVRQVVEATRASIGSVGSA